MSISQYQALFALIGTTYGGDGTSTFLLPNLQSRLPMHYGTGPGLSPRAIGEAAGTPEVTITSATMPIHQHAMVATTANATAVAVGNTVMPATVSGPQVGQFYDVPQTASPQLQIVAMNPNVCTSAGGNQPHDNLMPSLCITFIIALEGIFPSRN